jgi:hypothetical protein
MKLSGTFLAAALGLAFSTSAFADPILYLFSGDNSLGFKVDTNTSTYTSFATFSLGYPVAIVDNTILLHNRDDSASGGVAYDLNGNPTGVTWAGGGASVSQLLDGTSNGINNFAVQCCATSNSVWEASLTWQNFTPLFSLPTGESGITYDSASNSLYVVDFSGNLSQYSMTGTLLNSYTVASGIDAGLSYDPVTDTLWGVINGADSVIQESTTGSVLQTLTVSGLGQYNIYGGEIAGTSSVSSAPEPAATMMLGPALLALWYARKRLTR